MPTGDIVFILRAATDALPINNAAITVTDESGAVVFYELLTAANGGISRTARLESPPREISLESGSIPMPYSRYNVLVRAVGWYKTEILGVQLFEGSRTQLPITLIPLPEGITTPEDLDTIIIRIPEHTLRDSPPQAENETLSASESAIPAVAIGDGVFIPETITVHLGAPDENAQNVTVPFTDYIKNVASSEIYPTWPKESLRANILAQISLTLNRIYTEWYRSRGYNFDITNSTAYDQAFVFGRNLFDETNEIVDEIFNNYIVRPNRIEPLFASYCNGTTSTCAGLSQWGTVALAENGNNYDEILDFYYGDIDIAQTDDVRSQYESYPNTPLSEGASGDDVRIIQEQLNRIAINFPLLPLIEVNGIYNEQTVNSVREFQRLFVLPITGVTDRATWYRISQIYASVKRLSEITSEGQRASYNQQLYPGTPLQLSSRGSEVQELQFYLQRISRFNPVVESPRLDGIFGESTASAVRSFQRAYGISETGIVDEQSWNEIVRIYNGTLENPDVPSDAITPVPFPDYTVSQGQSGEYVLYIQQVLNVINNVFLTIPELTEDGIFGTATSRSVNEFALLFGFMQNGSIDKALWDKINLIYSTVLKNCIFASGNAQGTQPYPSTALSIGSEGESVRYIQQKISVINEAIPYIPSLVPDGVFGQETLEAVTRVQRVFGLEGNGRVEESTWLLINYLFTAIENGCLPKSAIAAFAEGEIREIKVSELKEIMRKNGINVGNGPIFGLKSRIALADWQSKRGLEPTGLPDYATRKALSLLKR
ncbi:MAG: peptidoglycan-binding protein [Clostridia bacterium]|nr:peptidoglycan-binding protein [Clostridia bacterium]